MNAEDVFAARMMLGSVNSNPMMSGLPGADNCIHSLAGSGITIDELRKGIGYDDTTLAQFAREPYRHHAYVQSGGPMRSQGIAYCVCGNTQGGAIHQRCDLVIDTSTRSQGE